MIITDLEDWFNMADRPATISAAAAAILAFSRWAAAGRRGKPPRTADQVLTEYAGEDAKLWHAMEREAIEEAERRGYRPQARSHRRAAA